MNLNYTWSDIDQLTKQLCCSNRIITDLIKDETFCAGVHYYTLGNSVSKGANAYLNKISTCVLQNLSVKYGGGRFSAHTPTSRGPDNLVGSTPPVESEISLSFKELEIITQNNVGRGF